MKKELTKLKTGASIAILGFGLTLIILIFPSLSFKDQNNTKVSPSDIDIINKFLLPVRHHQFCGQFLSIDFKTDMRFNLSISNPTIDFDLKNKTQLKSIYLEIFGGEVVKHFETFTLANYFILFQDSKNPGRVLKKSFPFFYKTEDKKITQCLFFFPSNAFSELE